VSTSPLHTVLPVGQGTGTLIQVIDNGEPTSTILIDLGSKGWKKDIFGTRSTEIVTTALKKMVKKGPTLDAVFLSHPDDDHINLIPDLLANFNAPGETTPGKQTLVINKVWFGGPEGSYAGKQIGNVLKKLQRHGATLGRLGGDASNLTKPEYSDAANGVDIFVMIANTISGNTSIGKSSVTPLNVLKSDDGYLVNTDSLVLAVRYGTGTKRKIVATGDATGMTMAAANERLSAARPNWLLGTDSISLPHHGSATTAYDVLNASTAARDTDDTAEEVVKEFVRFLQPEMVTISAGQSFNHPAHRVVDDFAQYTKNATYSDPALNNGEHFYTGYFEKQQFDLIAAMDYDGPLPAGAEWPRSANWRTVRTSKAIYAIDYYELDDKNPDLTVPVIVSTDISDEALFQKPEGPYTPLPPWGCAWEFTISQDGSRFDVSPKDPIKYIEAPPELPELIPRVPPPCPVPGRGPAVVRVTAQSSAALPRRHRVRALL
jgi:beta-lactamase superfamily II metal-dependent hydrolase